MPSPTYYEILSLSPTTLSRTDDDPAATTALLKRAYRRALLNHHPDKKTPTTTSPQQHQHHQPPKSTITITIDQISTAYATLSHPPSRKAYDLSLLSQSHSPSRQATEAAANFQTGIETLDLDDLTYEEDDSGHGTTRWYRPCRCGNPRGYLFTEDDLEEAADLGELMVGCADCSLWLRVCFAVVVEEGEDGGVNGGDGGLTAKGRRDEIVEWSGCEHLSQRN